ncbi:uncharacterized protein DUF4307 [Microcella putealis]|uniref:Uncharacterized protein DUF4307 n=1 Tax=Microcella putealis TaxID=337005 RepID=A0A4Q7LYP2_9MICO|nr:DUF4307 domain-containing protein [Microcella putealis]RZS59577.1 uncharacterized protein DUF4307 [Microcella putealis]TQM26690.1 uncharacterized protein DUF4307 [Microcella putealis]
MTAQQLLDERYGRTARDDTRTKRILIISGALFTLVFGAWVVWGGLSGTNAELEVRELGYRDLTDTSITVAWEVSVAPGTEVSCAVQALNANFGIVGWRVLELDSSDQRTRVFTETLRTSEQAVTGLPYGCWLP